MDTIVKNEPEIRASLVRNGIRYLYKKCRNFLLTLNSPIPVSKTGSCAASSFWFSRSPLPDLAGLFVGWMGTTGVITKLAIKLYPDFPYNDVRAFVTEDAELVPDIIYRLTRVQLAEDVLRSMSAKPDWLEGFQTVIVRYGAESKRELNLKRDMFNESVRKFTDQKIGGFMPLPVKMQQNFMQAPQISIASFADSRRGGGFEYVGAIMPVDLFAIACKRGVEIAERHGFPYTLAARIMGAGHAMMFSFSYPFNRADKADVANAQKALAETNQTVLEMGGIPWKAEDSAQKRILERLDPNTFNLMNRLRRSLDPKGIMNPGNWELD